MRNEELFRDVFNEAVAPDLEAGTDFETAILRKTVANARRARYVRLATRSAVAVMVALLAVFQFPQERDQPVVTGPIQMPVQETPNYTLLRTETFTGIVHSKEADPLLTSEFVAIPILKTGEADAADLKFINDEELLSFFSDQAVALVKHGPHESEL